jgi:hypothetical protein
MKDLVKLVSASDLIKPPIRENLPRWAKQIKKPMDLNTMRTLLIRGEYLSVTDFVIDFRNMICNVLRINGWDHEKSVKALTVLQWFHQRMRNCTIGPGEKLMAACDEDEIKRMASQIEDSMIKVTESPLEKLEVISIDDCDASDDDEVAQELDANDLEDTSNASDISHDMLDGHAFVAYNAKTPEPDDLDQETQQLQKEIEERQQKLANMAEKKRLLAEIKDLDTEKSAIDGQIPETKIQAVQLESKIQDCRRKITTLRSECDKSYQTGLWHRQEIERLQRQNELLRQESERCHRESEVHRQEDERLGPLVNNYLSEIAALDAEQKQVHEQGRQALENVVQHKGRRDKIEDQRAIIKRKFDELNSGSI